MLKLGRIEGYFPREEALLVKSYERLWDKNEDREYQHCRLIRDWCNTVILLSLCFVGILEKENLVNIGKQLFCIFSRTNETGIFRRLHQILSRSLTMHPLLPPFAFFF